ncbi:hypothetical protein VOLCADRAFT_105443 [Volvox carteri f. nagariensis]|uniref:Uncharacterized protein n=1 Tax=Volvox carteri f. nagariensis TaxID=3068 RepID=D8U0U7_VOLCA|nr:uncharacterized protein VOLCADRAFT_105443 [Volvox carteri f. nagariensis]EFJ46777.1 hypothetical protein VOLCADRAFT_105443 [Volvox carteri f. nagariensis]|eukprot:XP_002952306.1 hypothetical protein VOLCADRAFT_105443 [Volvox carteri f. nagariensis]
MTPPTQRIGGRGHDHHHTSDTSKILLLVANAQRKPSTQASDDGDDVQPGMEQASDDGPTSSREWSRPRMMGPTSSREWRSPYWRLGRGFTCLKLKPAFLDVCFTRRE